VRRFRCLALTAGRLGLAVKNADCEINEAQAVSTARRSYPDGAMLRTTHIVMPQARPYEVIIDKSFWTWGGEIGINGACGGQQAIFSTPQSRATG
jgi:hypothetical protein